MLNQFLISQLYGFLFVFMRVGAAIMVMPGFGEAFIAVRFRLLFAVMLSVVISPMLLPIIPPMPNAPVALFNVGVAEILIGILIGSVCRLLLSGIQTAAAIISTQASLTSALVSDVTIQSGQTTAMSNFLGVAVLVTIFAADLHHVMLKGIINSYQLFQPGVFPSASDAAELAVQTVSRSFVIALQMSAPHIITGTLLFVAAGVLGRLMPNIQVFFLIAAPQMLLGFFILLTVISAILLWYVDYFRDGLVGVMGS